MNTVSKILIVIICSFLVFPKVVSGQADENSIKAALLEKFTRFIEWPEYSNMEDSTIPFTIGVIGDKKFGKLLEEFYSEEKIQNRTVFIRTISKLNQIPDCQIIYIANTDNLMLSDIITQTKKVAMLTVGDNPGLAEKGVLINFYKGKNKVQFEINITAFEKSPLTVNYLLLKVGRIVETK